MNLTIEPGVYQKMVDSARLRAPVEACGLCGGVSNHISRFIEVTNSDASPEHYSMLPAEQFDAVRALRSEGLRLLALWHSHPATPARMSAEDLRLAYMPDIVYLILSLERPREPELRGFRVVDGASVEARVNIIAVSTRKDKL